MRRGFVNHNFEIKIYETKSEAYIAPGREVSSIAKSAPINMIIYYPQSEEGKKLLAQRVAEVHADSVIDRIKRLTCPSNQKTELFNAVLNTAKNENSSP